MWNGFKSCELWHHVSSIEVDEGTLVAHLIAIVRRAEHGNAVPIVLHLIAIRLCLQGSMNILDALLP